MQTRKITGLLGSILLILLTVSLVFTTACSSSTTTSATTTKATTSTSATPATTAATTAATTTSTTTTTAAGKAIDLRIAFGSAPVHSLVKNLLEPWAAALAEKTSGRVTATVYAGGALGPDAQQYDMLKTGGADVSIFNPGFTPGRFPLSSIVELPGMNPSIEVGTQIIQSLYDKYPDISKEYDPVKILCIEGQLPILIHTTKKAVRTLEDVKGLTLRVPNETVGKSVTLLGGSPVFMGMTDVYTALERGTIDGALYPYEAVKSFGMDQITKYTTEFALSTIQSCIGMNAETFNKLPEDVQVLITTGDLGRTWLTEKYIYAMSLGQQQGYEKILAKGSDYEIIKLSTEEQAKWNAALGPAVDQWIKDRAAEGKPGQAIADEAQQLLKDLTK